MAGIINTVKIKFTEEGADQAAAATENVNKAQTRLGNSSASNGRQFAAQSQGLGGLVAAYAGAAATSFALQQAFSALQKAAQFDQIIQGTNTFSSQFGQSASSVIGDVKRITQGQLSIVEAATSANIALSAGFNTKQLNELADVATKASRALGRDLQDSFQRLVRGSSKLEPELLDELGIFTRLEPAVEKYAAKVGKATSALSEFERRQAFVNAVISEGQSKFSIIDTSTGTAAQSFSRLAATLTDVALSIGNVLANSLAPLADYLNNNAAAAFGAFGVILGLVLSKLNEVSTVGLQNLTKRITEASNSVSNGFLGSGAKASKEALTSLSDSVQEYTNKLGQGLGPQRAIRNELIDLAKAGTISVNQARQLNGILVEQIARENTYIAVLEAKKKTVGATATQIAVYDAELRKLTVSLKQNEKAQIAAAAAIASQGKAAAAASFVTSIFGKAVGFIGSFITKALSFVNLLLLISSVASLIGPKLLEVFGLEGIFNKGLQILTQIGEKFLGLDAVSKQFQSGIKGVASSLTDAAFQAENVKSNLEGAVISKGKFGEFTIKINAETIQKDVADAINEGFKAAEQAQLNFLGNAERSSVGAAAGSRLAGGRQTPGLQALQEEAAALAALNNEEANRTRATQAYNAVIQTTINKLEAKRNIEGQDYNAQKLLDVQIRALRDVINLGKEQVQIGGLIADVTGVSAKRAYELVKVNKDGLGTLKTTGEDLQVQFYTQQQIARLSDKQKPAAKELNDIQAKLVGYSSSLLTANEKLQSGQLDLNNIGKIRSDLLANEEALQTQIQELIKKGAEADPKIISAKQAQLSILREQRIELNKQAGEQETVLRVQDAIRKTFSSQINALSNITGLVNANGTFATDDLEVNRNKLDILEKTVQAGEALRKSIPIQEGETFESTFNGTEKAIINAADSAKQALAGSILEALKKATDLTKEYEKQTIELQKQALSIRLNIQKEEIQLQQQLNDKQSEYNTLVIQNQINAIQRQQKVNDLASERIDILRKGREEEIKSQMSGVLGPLFTDKTKREIEIRFKEDELNDLKNTLAQQQATAKQVLEKEIALANEASLRETDRINTQERLNQIDAIQKAADIAFKIEDTKRQQELFVKQSQSIQEQITAFINHPRELGKVLNQFITDFIEIQKVITPDKAGALTSVKTGIQERENEATKGVAEQLKTAQERLASGADSLSGSFKNLLSVLEDQQRSVDKTVEGQKKQIELEKQRRDAIQIESIAAAQAKYNNVLKETGNRLLAAQQSLDILKREAERAGNSFITIAVKAAESFGSNLEKGINSLVDAIANGTLTLENFKQGFKQFIVSILSDITKSILNELITKPIKELVFGFTRDLITGLSGSTISDTLAKNITPAISSSLTASLGENVAKSISGLKEIGVTPVFVTNVAEFCACSSGNAAASGGANAAANAATSAAQGSAGRLIYNSPIGPNMPAATSAVQTVADKAGQKLYDSPIGPQVPAGGLPVEIQNTDAITQGITGAVTPAVTQAVTPAIGNIGTFGGSTLYKSPELFSPSTWSGNVLQPTTDKAFGAIGPMTGIGFNGTVRGGNGLGPGNATTFGGTAPQNLGIGGGSSQFTTQQFTNPAFSTDAGGKLQNRVDALDPTQGKVDTAGFQESLDKCEESITQTAGGFDDFSSKLGIGSEGVTQLADSSNTGVTSLTSLATTSGIVETAKAGEQVASVAETVATQTTTPAIVALGAAAQASAAQMGGGTALAGNLLPIPVGAVGGIVGGGGAFARFVAGGGVRMRDSVPALLEPGEFVMKKSSVDSIGRNSLERMNATGKSSGGGPTNIKVQVENQGNPKEAEQRDTQFDGETAIVKLILKDLNSNGPIRRSIRGNT